MKELPEQRWGCLLWGIVVVLLGGLLSYHLYTGVQRGAEQMEAKNNCAQIVVALMHYAKHVGSGYPDGRLPSLKSANQVFRELFQEGIVLEERIFGCPNSMFNPDNDMGIPPNYEKVLMPGECHWMLLKHQSAASHGKTPVVIENSLNATWPPKWDVSFWAGNKRGRAWYEESVVIIGRNDGSVSLEELRSDSTLDWHSPPNLDEHGKSWIDYLTPEQVANLSYWDIEEK
jgi:hypothetical protein